MIKNIILTSACENKNLKGILTLESTQKNTIVTLKKYNFEEPYNKLVLGIKVDGEFYKVETTNEETYLINKSLNLNQKISAVLISCNNLNTKILVWGSNETSRVWKESILYDINEKSQVNKEEDFSTERNFQNESISLSKKPSQDELNNLSQDDEIENTTTLDYETDEEIDAIVDNAFQNEDLEDLDEENENNEQDFLSSIESQVEELLNNYEEETALENLIPNSKFVKVNSNEENFYIFGVIKENERIKYIVYGLPGEFSVKPEDEYKNYYQWLPLNPENPEGYGYYLMYQDAESGNQIEVMFD